MRWLWLIHKAFIHHVFMCTNQSWKWKRSISDWMVSNRVTSYQHEGELIRSEVLWVSAAHTAKPIMTQCPVQVVKLHSVALGVHYAVPLGKAVVTANAKGKLKYLVSNFNSSISRQNCKTAWDLPLTWWVCRRLGVAFPGEVNASNFEELCLGSC